MTYGEEEYRQCPECYRSFLASEFRNGECRQCWFIGKAEHDAEREQDRMEEDRR